MTPSSAASPSFPPPRVTPNLAHAFGGVLRLALYRFAAPNAWLWTLGAMLVVGVLAGTGTRAGDHKEFLSWSTEFYIAFLLPTLAFLSGGGAIRDEMKGNAVDYILTRPVPRWAYLLFRYVAQWVSTQISYLPVFAVLAGVGIYHHIPGLGSALPALLLGQALSLTVFLAFGFFAGVLTPRYVVLGLTYGATVEVGLGHIPVQLSQLSMTHQLRAFLERLPLHEPLGLAAVQTSAVVIGTAVGLLIIAAALFAHRELAGARPSET